MFIEPAKKNILEKWFKIIYHNSGNEFVTFKIFNYNDEESLNKLPFYGFEKLSAYKHLTDTQKFEGVYRGKPDFIIDYFEVKKINEKQFLYIFCI